MKGDVLSVYEIIEITQNFDLMFNPTNKQHILTELADDNAFDPYFSGKKNVQIIVPNKAAFSVTLTRSDYHYILSSDSVPVSFKPEQLILLTFGRDSDGRSVITQGQVVKEIEHYGQSFLLRRLYVSAVDPRRFKRKNLQRPLTIYPVPSAMVESFKQGATKILRKVLSVPTSRSRFPILSVDFIRLGDGTNVEPASAFAEQGYGCQATSIDISLGGMGLNVNQADLKRIVNGQLVYLDLKIDVRGVRRSLFAFAVVRLVKPNKNGGAFIALMFLEALSANVFK